MDVVLYVNIAAVFFAFLESRGLFKKGLLVSFLIIFIFLALRSDYGNDYIMYSYFFEDLNNGKYDSLGIAGEHFEIGYTFVNQLFKFFNFEVFIIFLSFFNSAVVYKFIKEFVPANYYWLAVFIYVFNPDFMLIHLSALRQMIAIMIMLMSLKKLLNKDYLTFICYVAIAYLFHTSALALLLLIPITYFDWTKYKMSLPICSLLYLSLFVLSSYFGDFINSFVNIYFARYSVYSSAEGEVNSGIGFAIYFVFLIFLLISAKNVEIKGRKIISVFIIALILSTLAIKVMMIFRLNMYFTVFAVASFPLMMRGLRNQVIRAGLIILVFVLYLHSFFGFFDSEIYGDHYKIYKTVFDQ